MFGCVFSGTPLGVERQALHSPGPAASSTTAASTSKEEGLHAAVFLTTSASTSATSLCTSEEEGLHTGLPPRNVGMYIGGGGTGPLPHNVGVFFGGRETGSRPHSDECFMCHKDEDPLFFVLGKHVVVVAKVVSNGAVPLNIPRLA